jgi:hypothetical protein
LCILLNPAQPHRKNKTNKQKKGNIFEVPTETTSGHRTVCDMKLTSVTSEKGIKTRLGVEAA